MKLFLTKVTFYSFLFLILWIVSVGIIDQYGPSILKRNIIYRRFNGTTYTKSRLIEAKTVTQVDILVLGSSHAYRGYDPRIMANYGISMFNLGTSAQTPIQTKFLVENFLNKINPKVVIFDVFPMTFRIKGLESTLEIIPNMTLDIRLLNLVLEINELKAYNSFACHVFNNFVGTENLSLGKGISSSEENLYVKGGFVERRCSYPFNSKIIPTKNIEFMETQVMAFQEIIKTLREHKIKTILVQTPVTLDEYQSVKNNSEIDEYFSSFKNVSYYNMNKLLRMDEKLDFYDSHHLTQQGVIKFNEFLVESILIDNFSVFEQK